MLSVYRNYEKRLFTRRGRLLVHQIHRACRYEEEFNPNLCVKLEQVPQPYLQSLAQHKIGGTSPLVIAIQQGKARIVDYLLRVCHVNSEEKITLGTKLLELYAITPLMYAVQLQNLNVIRSLVENGAKIDVAGDDNYSALLMACRLKSSAIVDYLLAYGANVHQCDHDGNSCLMYSVANAATCDLLLLHGAQINLKNAALKTALHVAVFFNLPETVRLLLDRGSDPTLEDENGEDVLMFASLRGLRSREAFDRVIDCDKFANERRAEACELIGSSIVLQSKNIQLATHYWSKALNIRQNGGELLSKQLESSSLSLSRMAIQPNLEFNSVNELNSLSKDPLAMETQALLINNRVLGPTHNFSLESMKSAIANAQLDPQRSINLWLYKLYVETSVHDLMSYEPLFKLTELFKELLGKRGMMLADGIFTVVEISILFLEHCHGDENELHYFDLFLRFTICHLWMFLAARKQPSQAANMKFLIRKMIKADFRTENGDNLLHLAVSTSTHDLLAHVFEGWPASVNPTDFQKEIVKYLLDYGCDVNSVNKDNDTPLHLAARIANRTAIETLLRRGARVESPDEDRDDPNEIRMKKREIKQFRYLKVHYLGPEAVPCRQRLF